MMSGGEQRTLPDTVTQLKGTGSGWQAVGGRQVLAGPHSVNTFSETPQLQPTRLLIATVLLHL